MALVQDQKSQVCNIVDLKEQQFMKLIDSEIVQVFLSFLTKVSLLYLSFFRLSFFLSLSLLYCPPHSMNHTINICPFSLFSLSLSLSLPPMLSNIPHIPYCNVTQYLGGLSCKTMKEKYTYSSKKSVLLRLDREREGAGRGASQLKVLGSV